MSSAFRAPRSCACWNAETSRWRSPDAIATSVWTTSSPSRRHDDRNVAPPLDPDAGGRRRRRSVRRHRRSRSPRPMSFPAFFDTCALFGGSLNDLLLRLADEHAYRPLWSRDVLNELERNLSERVGPEAAHEAWKDPRPDLTLPRQTIGPYFTDSPSPRCTRRRSLVLQIGTDGKTGSSWD